MTIKEYDFSSKRALIRVDFNVPFDNETGLISDDTRIKLAIPTIKWVLSKGGSVVLMSHMGRPKDMYQQEFSLNRIVTTLNELLGEKVHFLADCISEESFNCTKNLKPGQVVLLENLRFYAQEKKGDVDFAKQLARHGDVYINDAFGTAHRAHASTTIVANFFPSNKLFGFLIENEIKSVNKVLESDDKPLTWVMPTGRPITRYVASTAMQDEMQSSLVLGSLFVFITLSIGFRSPKQAAVTLIPILLVVVWLYGLMNAAGSSLNIVTVTIATISLGVGIDYCIHVTERYRESREKGETHHEALVAVGGACSMALIGSAASDSAGFLVIALSPMGLFSNFGIYSAAMISLSLIASLILTTAALGLLSSIRSEGISTTDE